MTESKMRGRIPLSGWRAPAAGAVAACSLALAVSPAAAAVDQSRSFEKITPADKNGGQVLTMYPVVSPGADAVLFGKTASDEDSPTSAIDNAFVARRTKNGWSSRDVTPVPVAGESRGLPVGLTADANRVFFTGRGQLDPEQPFGMAGTSLLLYGVDTTTSGAELLSRSTALDPPAAGFTRFLGASPSGATSVFTANEGLTVQAAAARPNALKIYRRRGAGTQVVSILPDGTVGGTGEENVEPAAGADDTANRRHAVSVDGERVFFIAGQRGAIPPLLPLYVRDGDTRTVAISASERTGEEGAEKTGVFISASPDGNSVYFSSPDPLTDGVEGEGIYRYRLSDGELTRLTGDPGPDGLGMTSSAASSDMSTLAFVATASLAPGAVAGERNTYAWSDGELRLIAPQTGGARIARVSPNGSYVVLSATASLSGADTGGFETLYRYATRTRDLECVSCRDDGAPNAGESAVDMRQGSYFSFYGDPRAVTDDGRVFFTSRDRLVAEDPSATPDAYEFTDQGLRMLSTGRGSTYVMDNTDDGGSVFMVSTAALTADDTDGGSFDLYVRRAGGGFPLAAPDPSCAGDGCQPDTRMAGPADSPGSTATGAGNVAPASPPAVTPRLLGAPMITASGKRALARGRATVRIRVRGAGQLTVTASGRVNGKTRTLGTASRAKRGAGSTTMTLTLRLNAAARRELRQTKRLRIRIEARLSTSRQPRVSTITLKGSAR